jgi:transposase
VCAKRLEKGRFRWPEAAAGQSRITLTQEELALLLGGIDLSQTRRRAWYGAMAAGQREPQNISTNKCFRSAV